jgi:hypothetical protein
MSYQIIALNILENTPFSYTRTYYGDALDLFKAKSAEYAAHVAMLGEGHYQIRLETGGETLHSLIIHSKHITDANSRR